VFLKIGKRGKKVEPRCLEGGTCVVKKIFEEAPALCQHTSFPEKLQAVSKYLTHFAEGVLFLM
jgi:hypothetical protein